MGNVLIYMLPLAMFTTITKIHIAKVMSPWTGGLTHFRSASRAGAASTIVGIVFALRISECRTPGKEFGFMDRNRVSGRVA